MRIPSVLKYIRKAIPLEARSLRYITPAELKNVRLAPELTGDTVIIKHYPRGITGISETGLNRGVRHLTGSAARDTLTLKPIVEECFVGIKSKDDAIKIFQRQFEEVAPDRALYILNPSPLEKLERGMGTSNSFMSELYREANSTGTIIDRANVAEMVKQIAKNGEKKITIVVPDDFAGSGRSILVNTAETMRSANIPPDVDIELIISPMCATPFSQKAFEMFSKFDAKGLMSAGVLNKNKLVGKNSVNCVNDSEILSEFIKKYKHQMTIRPSNYIIEAKPYNETIAYRRLKDMNPDAAQAIDILMTEHGKGYGRPGSCGTMVLVPGRGNVLKAPNNNCYGALPFILSEGGTIGFIKNSNQKWSAKKWEVYAKKMAKELGVL